MDNSTDELCSYSLTTPSRLPISIEFNSGHCGSGKTRYLCQMMAKTEGRYVLAIDRRELAAARDATIREFAGEHGTDPVIVHLYSQSKEREGGTINVRRKIREAAFDYAVLDHVIVIVTHEGLKTSDLSGYGGWTLLIDEMLTIWTFGTLRTPAAFRYLREAYRLEDFAAGWSKVTAIAASGITTADLHDDELLSDLAVFDRRVRGQGVVTSLKDWESAAGGDPWSWYSVWSPEELRAFDRVILVANSVESSITYRLLTDLLKSMVRFVPFEIAGSPEPYLPRTMTIRYFAHGHSAGSYFFKSAEGRKSLERVRGWLSENLDGNASYWSSNIDLFKGAAPPGKPVRPRAAGRNDLSGLTTCSMIYSAKPSRGEADALNLLGITSADIIRTRETEDIHQMAWRGSLRDPSNPAPFTLYVYDRVQAETEARLIAESGLPIDVEIEHIDIGLDQIERKKPGRPPVERSDADKAEKVGRARLLAKERQAKRRAKMREAA